MESKATAAHPSTHRPYYVAPSPEDYIMNDTFGRASSSSSSRFSGSGSGNAGASTSSTSTTLLPSRYATVHDLVDDVDVVGNGASRSLPGLLQYYTSATLLAYASTACVMPFEVGKILLQIQWIPKADVQVLNEDESDVDGEGGEGNFNFIVEDVEEPSDEEDAQAYFHDLHDNGGASFGRRRGNKNSKQSGRGSSPRQRRRRGDHTPATGDESEGAGRQRARPVRPPLGAPSLSITAARDDQGYIIRRSVFESATKPEWILPFTVTGGVWEMMKSIARWKGEGWQSLWKGQLTTLLLDTISSSIQPALFSFLTAVILRDSPFVTLPLVHIPSPVKPFALTVVSHIVTGYLLSPLDLIRTRLVAQSSQPRHRKYSGPLDAFNQIREDEGGLITTYFSANLAIPALLDAAFRSFFTLGVPLFIERQLGLTPDSNAILYGLAEFGFSSISLLFTLPIETVRRRLQIQSRSPITGHIEGKKTYKTCVETRPTPYYGVGETVYRILTEETAKLHLYNVDQKPRRPSLSRRASSTSSTAGGGPSRRTSYRGTSTTQQQQQTQSSSLSPETAGLKPGEIEEDKAEEESMPFYAGVAQLYRGLSMSLSANLIVLVLGMVAGKEGQTTGWTEI